MEDINWKESCITRFAPVKEKIIELAAQKDHVLVAIDGKCASGKTTLGAYLVQQFPANLIHMDDFFLQKHQRTEERLAEVGGNVDYERFKSEVIDSLCQGKTIQYRPFSCHDMELKAAISITPQKIIIIEGSYSRHPYFKEPYDLSVFMEISEEDQIRNIKRRNGAEAVSVFREKWIPKELAYFEKFNIKENSDIVVDW